MRNSAPIARWRNSQGVLKQTWYPTGRLQTRALTQEHLAIIRRPRPNAFALLLALGYLAPAFASGEPALFMASAVMTALVLIQSHIERHVGSHLGFASVMITCAGFGSALALVAPNNHWLLDGLTGALWGTAVAAASWRSAPRPADPHE